MVTEEKELGATYVSFDELLAQSDVISINCPLTPETTKVFNKAAFDKMKDGAYLVNTARVCLLPLAPSSLVLRCPGEIADRKAGGGTGPWCERDQGDKRKS